MTRCAALLVLTLAGVASAETIVIEHATIRNASGKDLLDATITIEGGVITDVKETGARAAGAQVIDATGKIVTAGLIDAVTSVGVSEVAQVSDTNEGQFGGERGGVFAAYRVSDGFNESSVAIPIARSHGVTTAVVAPGGGFIAGIGAAFAMVDASGGKPREVRAEVALYGSLGMSALATNFGSRGMAVARVRELFDDAERYGRNRAAFDRNQSRPLAAPPLDLEALLLVKNGTLPLVLAADRASDIRAAIELAAELKIRVVVRGGTEAWMLADDLAKAKIGVILDPASNLPSSFDEVHVREDGAALLANAGVSVMISTLGEAANVRNLRQLAGIGVARGLTFAQALAAVTTTPAQVFGLGKRGSVEKGFVADLVVWSGDPFENTVLAEKVFIGGVEQSLETRQSKLFKRYRKLR